MTHFVTDSVTDVTDTVLLSLQKSGFSLAIVGESLRVNPRSRITDEVRALVRANKAGLFALLNKQSGMRRKVIFCRDCEHHLPMPKIARLHGTPLEAPGGCRLARTTPDSWPPIYPFTGWFCEGWMPLEHFGRNEPCAKTV